MSDWWQSAPLADGNSPEAFGAEQMRSLRQTPTSGFAGVTSPTDWLDAQEKQRSPTTREDFMAIAKDPNASPEERERALNMNVRLGEPEAAGNALIGHAALATLPLSKEAAIRAGWGLLGGSAGGAGGAAFGKGLEAAGAPKGTSAVTGTIGGLVGGFAGGFGKGAALEKLGEAVANPIARGARRSVGRELAGALAQKGAPAQVGTATAQTTVQNERTTALIDQLMRGETNLGKMGREQAEALATKMLQQPDSATIAKSVDTAVRTAQASKSAESALKGSRVRIGAEKVGRSVGKTKEEIRRETGPILDEAPGEASPILPEKALYDIIDKMRTLPKEGPAREAYVAAATSGKTKAQAELVRRTLERVGLLLPLGAVAAEEGF